MMEFLPAYWLEGLLAGGFVLLLALPFVWLQNLNNKTNEALATVAENHFKKITNLCKDFHDLNEKFKALDKPSNDKALENIAVILKKKISKQPTKLIRPRTLKKANGARSHAR